MGWASSAIFEVMVEGFNLFNRLNFASVNNTVGSDPANPDLVAGFRVNGRKDRSPSQPLGFTSAFEPRRIQIGLRFNF